MLSFFAISFAHLFALYHFCFRLFFLSSSLLCPSFFFSFPFPFLSLVVVLVAKSCLTLFRPRGL